MYESKHSGGSLCVRDRTVDEYARSFMGRILMQSVNEYDLCTHDDDFSQDYRYSNFNEALQSKDTSYCKYCEKYRFRAAYRLYYCGNHSMFLDSRPHNKFYAADGISDHNGGIIINCIRHYLEPQKDVVKGER